MHLAASVRQFPGEDNPLKETQSYLNPKVEARPNEHKGGGGVYAIQPVHSGELILCWGGAIVTEEQLYTLSERQRSHSIQVEEGLYQVTLGEPEPADYINHSCEANAGLSGQICIVALRDINPGEEICFDYGTSDGSPYDEFDCACGAPHCRKHVTGSDWMLPELWERYEGHFMPYLQRRIDKLKA